MDASLYIKIYILNYDNVSKQNSYLIHSYLNLVQKEKRKIMPLERDRIQDPVQKYFTDTHETVIMI